MTKKFDGKWYRRVWGEPTKEAAKQWAKRFTEYSYVRIIPETLNGMKGYSIFTRPKSFPSGTIKSAEEWNRICRNLNKEK